MWPDERVARVVTDNFIAARVHVKHNADAFKRYSERYKALWTPTILVLDPDAVEHHRIEGFLPAEDLLGQLLLGLARLAFDREQWKAAEQRFEEIVERFPQSEAAAEALYWAGVTRYKATGDPAPLQETARAFKQRYRETPWAKKASVWG